MTRLFHLSLPALALVLASCGGSDAEPSAAIADPLATDEIAPFEIKMMQNFYRINLEQTQSLIKNNRTVLIIDLRTAEEFAESHLPGANHYDLHFIKDGQEGVLNYGFQQNMGVVDRSLKILLYDDGGFENSLPLEANLTLKSIGFQEVYHFVGGLDEWVEAGLPTVTDLAIAE